MLVALIVAVVLLVIMAATLANAIHEVVRLRNSLHTAHTRMHMMKSSLHSQCFREALAEADLSPIAETGPAPIPERITC